MADDPYDVLGVARDATDGQIRSAFLALAKTSHPDLHPGDAAAEERFKRAGAADDLLSDPERRARFDRGEIDAAGHERPPPGRRFYREQAQGSEGARYGSGFGGDYDLGDILDGLSATAVGPARAGKAPTTATPSSSRSSTRSGGPANASPFPTAGVWR